MMVMDVHGRDAGSGSPCMKNLPFIFLLLMPTVSAHSQTYIFDGDLTAPGLQNGNGAWSTNATVPANLRWFKDDVYSAWDNSGLAIAEFGNTTSVNGGTLTLDGEIKLAGMNFKPLGTPIGTLSHAFNGGTLNFGEGGVINVSNAASGGSTGGQWISFSSLLKGNNLTIQKADGTTTAFIRINSVNTELTGVLTLKSATSVTSGIYASVGSPTYISNLSSIDVQAGSIFNPTNTGNYTTPLSIAGSGASNYGAVRVDSSNSTFSGGITLKADARFHTHINTYNVTLTAGIGETGGSWAFTRTAAAPVNTLQPLALTYGAASNYTGSTIFGRTFAFTSTGETSGTEGGINILDFAAATAPVSNLLYNNTTAGGLQLLGGLATTTVLQLNGAAGVTNSQSFGSVAVQQSGTAIRLNSGIGGSMNLNMGSITRVGNAVLAITAPASGSITGNVGGVDEGLIGAWATYSSANGATGGWAGLNEGAVGLFTGDLLYQSAVSVSSLSGYSAASHLQISADSVGDVAFDSGVTDLNTVSMTDTTATRQLDLAGKTLRLGASGGIQMIQGAQALRIGTVGDGSILTVGGATNAAGQIHLTNMSTVNPLTISSSITNNGTGAVSVLVNGTGRTILDGTNTFTGIVAVYSGVLDVRHGQALGATGSTGVTKVMAGASLNLSGGITVGETIQVNGHGIALDGAIRNLSGVNTLTTSVRIQSTTRISSDSGKLILAGGLTTQSSGTGFTFSGSGDIEVTGLIAGLSGVLTKEGSGTLTLASNSTGTGATTVSNGTMHLNFNAATAPATNILYNGATAGAFTLGGTLQATGKADVASSQTLGAFTFPAGASRISATSTGTGSMDITFGTITRNLGTTVRFDLPASGTIKTSAGTDNALLTGVGGVAYATVGENDWAATTTAVSSLRNIVGLSSINGYTASTALTLANNADVATGQTVTALAADTAIKSLRFNQPQATNIGQDATDRILSTGGILVTPAVGANVSTISTAGLRGLAGSTELVIVQNNTAAPLLIQSTILNATNAGGTANVTTALTKTGPGAVIIEYDRVYTSTLGDYTGATRIQNGSLQLVKTVSTGISYALNSGTTFTLGSGSTSGKLILGSPSTGYAVTQYGGLRTEGSGSNNAVVSGTTLYATFLHYVSGVQDFRKGFLGGSGENENNLHLTISLGTLQLGPANTFKGKTTLLQNTIEVTKLADYGLPSSLGTGDATVGARTIDMTTVTTSGTGLVGLSTLRYIGDTNSITNRPLYIFNSDVATDVISVTAALENTGTGTVKFTSAFTAGGNNPVDRVLRLGGTNRADNEIVSFVDASPTILGKVEKTGIGTWIMTGASTYGGGTAVNEGMLLVTTQTGSGTGRGSVTVASGAVLGGSGRIAPDADRSITYTGGTLQIGTELPGVSATAASSLTIQTSGTGQLNFLGGTTLTFDLFTGAGLGDNTGISTSADLAIILGAITMDADTVLRVSNPTGMTNWAYNDQWRLFDWSGLTGPALETVPQYDLPTLPSGLMWNTEDLFTTGILSVALVPEPSRMILLVTAFVAFVSRRRRSSYQLGEDPLRGQ